MVFQSFILIPFLAAIGAEDPVVGSPVADREDPIVQRVLGRPGMLGRERPRWRRTSRTATDGRAVG
ncbi:hypothetical protein [Rathayibacter festucae]|uniref:Uncharacterized protein n=2 Tax=Rathayibacter festucae TaxID=110937 RepID=A0A3T0T3B9_9MICO|nr:hypothetical protein [Rathayibacter festucae]AZZ53091.1 hypothetical protein C1I64_14305 [Rathayibacter festucae DSM 15932]QHC61589.1 hypothetical protein GSU69_01975 [Rathayibacter festucae]